MYTLPLLSAFLEQVMGFNIRNKTTEKSAALNLLCLMDMLALKWYGMLPIIPLLRVLKLWEVPQDFYKYNSEL